MENTIEHYQDDCIDMRVIYPSLDGFNETIVVMTNRDGKTKSIFPETWWFNLKEYLDSYGELYRAAYGEDGIEEHLAKFKQYLFDVGEDVTEEDFQ